MLEWVSIVNQLRTPDNISRNISDHNLYITQNWETYSLWQAKSLNFKPVL
jgi:hypothetical protein